MKRPSQADLDKKKTELETPLRPVERTPHNSEIAASPEEASHATTPTHDEAHADIDHALESSTIRETTRIGDREYNFFYIVQLQFTNLFKTTLFLTIWLKA